MTKHWEEQMNHEPTRLYYEAIVAEANLRKPERTLEIGSAWGVSTHALINSSEYLVSIDVNECPQAYGEVEDLGMKDKWRFMLGDSTAMLKQLQAEKAKFDLVFIDGDHCHKKTYSDIVESWPLLKSGGAILFDDAWHTGNFDGKLGCSGAYGVTLAIRQFCLGNNLSVIFRPTPSGMAIIEKP